MLSELRAPRKPAKVHIYPYTTRAGNTAYRAVMYAGVRRRPLEHPGHPVARVVVAAGATPAQAFRALVCSYGYLRTTLDRPRLAIPGHPAEFDPALYKTNGSPR